MRIRLEKKGEALIPSLPIDEIALGGVKQNQIVEVELKRPRNAMFHKKFFALIGIVLENTEYQNTEQVLHLIKIKLGYYDTVIDTSGEVFYMPRSISFSSMDNDSFSMFYNDTVNLVLSDFLTNWQDSDIQNAIDQVVRF